MVISKKLLFSKVSEGSNFFKGGPTFSKEGGLVVASQKVPLKKTIHLNTKTNVWTYSIQYR